MHCVRLPLKERHNCCCACPCKYGVPQPSNVPLQDYDHVALLAQETVQEGHSVLVFCGTKAACEHTAKRAAR